MAVGPSLFNVDKTCKKDSDHDKRFVRERRVHTRLAALTDGDARRLRHGGGKYSFFKGMLQNVYLIRISLQMLPVIGRNVFS